MGGMRCLIGGPAPVDLKKGDSYPLIHLNKKQKKYIVIFSHTSRWWLDESKSGTISCDRVIQFT